METQGSKKPQAKSRRGSRTAAAEQAAGTATSGTLDTSGPAGGGRTKGPASGDSLSPPHSSSGPTKSSSSSSLQSPGSCAQLERPSTASTAGAAAKRQEPPPATAPAPRILAAPAPVARRQWLFAACCVALVAACMALHWHHAGQLPSRGCHPQLGSTVVGALVALAPPVWHEQLEAFGEELSCEALSAAGAKARAVTVLCRSAAECHRAQAAFPRADFCLHVQQFGSSATGDAGHLQKQLTSLASQCQYGMIVLQNALTSGLSNVHTLIAALSELGHLTRDGAIVRLHTFIFVLVEQVPPDDVDSLPSTDDWEAAQLLRRGMRARLMEHYGAQWGSNEAAVLDAVLRRVDVVATVQ